MFHKQKTKIMELFFEEPGRIFQIREISRIIKLAPTSVRLHLKELKDEKLIKIVETNIYKAYKADVDSINYKLLKQSYNKLNLFNSGLIDFIETKYDYPESIILFGSYQKGENIKRSDIDIAVVTETKKEPDLDSFEKKLKHKIQLFEISSKDVENLSKDNPELLNNLINGSVVYGTLEIFR